ncbi:MAG: hypothetical protein NTX76_03255 [Alphaproteobacteria bacterium]|nr:hypothetical protein [Alphaproteobacteria bacterium]
MKIINWAIFVSLFSVLVLVAGCNVSPPSKIQRNELIHTQQEVSLFYAASNVVPEKESVLAIKDALKRKLSGRSSLHIHFEISKKGAMQDARVEWIKAQLADFSKERVYSDGQKIIDNLPANEIKIVIDRYQTVSPKCKNSLGGEMVDFGCSVENNLSAMISDQAIFFKGENHGEFNADEQVKAIKIRKDIDTDKKTSVQSWGSPGISPVGSGMPGDSIWK